MKLPEQLRDELKIPLGRLLLENEATQENIKKYLAKNPFVITVGDRTTEKMIEFGMIPTLQIIDGQEKRLKRNIPSEHNVSTILTCENPAAEITQSSIDTIKKAFTLPPPVRIKVIGEEDLLVIPVCIHAPENSVVMYGQPNEGLVIVEITPEIRNKTQKLFELME